MCSDGVRTPRQGECIAPGERGIRCFEEGAACDIGQRQEFRTVKPIINVDSDLEEDEEGLHIDLSFGWRDK